ncbi:UNVERIFIED_CONTAM: hypothetical protein RMT77_011677 [Armadillidium vulgare]
MEEEFANSLATCISTLLSVSSFDVFDFRSVFQNVAILIVLSMKAPQFLDRIWKDLKRQEFVPLKVLYFLVYGGMMALFPFLSIQARSLGIEEQEIGTIYGALPLLGIFAASISGIIADKIGNFKVFLSITMATSGLSSLVFLAIPVGRIVHQMPDILPLSLNCSGNSANMAVVAPYTCDYSTSSNLTAYVTSCNIHCSNDRGLPLEMLDLKDSKFCSLIPGCGYHDNQDLLLKDLHSHLELSEKDAYESLNMPITQNSVYPIVPIRIQLVNSSEDGTEMKLLNDYCPVKRKELDSSEEDSDYEDDLSNSCWVECAAEIARQDMCSNEVTVESINPVLTISVYVLVRTMHTISLVTSLPLFEGATMAILQEQGGDIGLQRLYSNVGQVVMTPLSGALIDAFSYDGLSNFRPAFYLYCIISIISAICISFIDLEFKKPAKNISEELKKLLTKFEVIVFICAGFTVGVAFGVIDTFLFWILENMGASKSLMGLTITVGCSFGIPMMLFAVPIINKIGHVNTLILGMLFIVIRLVGYSLITNPWWVMPFEGMECFTTALFTVAQVSYAASLSTPSTLVSLQTLMMGFLHIVGRGVGSLMGGFMTKSVGLKFTFRIMAFICALGAAIYFFLNFFFFRKNEENRKLEKLREQSERKLQEDEKCGTLRKGEKNDCCLKLQEMESQIPSKEISSIKKEDV